MGNNEFSGKDVDVSLFVTDDSNHTALLKNHTHLA